MTLENLITADKLVKKTLNHFGFNELSKLKDWALENREYFIEECKNQNLEISLFEPIVNKEPEPESEQKLSVQSEVYEKLGLAHETVKTTEPVKKSK